MDSPRLLFAAPASGSGKTTLVCGLLRALKNRGRAVRAFKCGPDFIDPLFHETVVGVPSGTLDLFFSPPDQLRQLFCRHAEGAEVSLIEGVMGYYDGLGAATDRASSYAVAEALDTPVVLIVDSRGQSLSALATLAGFLSFRPDSRIRGVIFNRMSEGVYAALRPEVERLGVLRHVERDKRLFVAVHFLGEHLRKVRLADAGWPEEEERADRALGIGHKRTAAAKRTRNRLYRGSLPDDDFAKRLLHAEKLFRCRGVHLLDRNAAHRRDGFSYILFGRLDNLLGVSFLPLLKRFLELG